jgi:hypothetical protein
MCWSTYNYTWQSSLRLVEAVDLPNCASSPSFLRVHRWPSSHLLPSTVGLVLDAFHIAGYEYADPTLPSGIRTNGPARLAASLEELVKTVPLEKVFYLQLVDAELLSPPLLPLGAPPPKEEEVGMTVNAMHVDGQQPRMTWSRNSRFVVFSTFLRLELIVTLAGSSRRNRLVVGTCPSQMCTRLSSNSASRGSWGAFLHLLLSLPSSSCWLYFRLTFFSLSLLLTSHDAFSRRSLELFTRFIQLSDPSIPTEHAERGWKSWQAIHKKLGIEL